MTGHVRQVRNAKPGHSHDGYGRVFRYHSRELVAIWHGGEYVDLFTPGTSTRDALSGDAIPFDCLNVWDHEHDRPRIARTSQGFRAYMNEAMSSARVVYGAFPGEVWLEQTDDDA